MDLRVGVSEQVGTPPISMCGGQHEPRSAHRCDAATVTPDQFLARCNQLWHVAPAGTWKAISDNGLRTGQQLIEAADLDEETRTTLLTAPRSETVRLKVGENEVVLRDQEALLRADLPSLLEPGTTISDWVQLLNRRAYLFTDKVAMRRMLDKNVERDGAQEVLSFSPLRLFDAARPQIELSAQNSGGVPRKSDPHKGRDTFLSITRFPDKKPAVVTIVDGLPDIAGIVMRVEHHEIGKPPITIT